MRILLAAALLLVGVGCTGEDATPVDLSPTTTTVVDPHGSNTDDVDPNAEVRAQAQQLADDQCLEDESLVEGTIQIVDPDTNEVVGVITADCQAVRLAAEE